MRPTLALDLSGWVGYAAGTSPLDVTWGDFPLADPELLEVAPAGEKGANFESGLTGLIAHHVPECLLVEQAFFGKNTHFRSGEQQLGLYWQAQAIAWTTCCKFASHHVNIVRAGMGVKVPRGSKDAKPLVMRYVRALGYRVDSDHQGDALLLWLYQWCLLTTTKPVDLQAMLVPA